MKHYRPLFMLLLLLFATTASTSTLVRQREILIGANSIAGELSSGTIRTLAVVDFTDLRGGVTELGRFVAEEMALGLASSGKGLSIIDRTHLKALMQEHKLGASGLIDPTTARKLGQIAGVQGLVTGTITPFADSVRVVVKVLDTENARIITATSLDITKNRTIEELLGRDIPISSMTGPSPAAPSNSRPGPSTSPSSIILNGRLRISLNQMSVSEDNYRATVSLTIENTSKEPVLLGAETQYGDVKAALSDDRGTVWRPNDAKGIAVIQDDDLSRIKDAALTPIAPAEQVIVIITFARQNGTDTPGTTFSVAIDGLISTGNNLRRASLGISSIKPAGK